MTEPKRKFGKIGKKRKNTTNTELNDLLNKSPCFPGIPLHVCTDEELVIEEDDLERASTYEEEVTIHSLAKNSNLDDDSEIRVSKNGVVVTTWKAKSTSTSWVIGKLNSLNEANMIPITKSGAESRQGNRQHMEDRFVNIDEIKRKDIINNNENKNITYYGVYDGHCGHKAADLCQELLHTKLLSEVDFDEEDISQSISDCFKSFDEYIINTGTKEGWIDGSCVSICVIVDSVLYAANVGDSSIVLSEKKKKIPSYYQEKENHVTTPSKYKFKKFT
eukprot:TRINITY_DN6116_c0_g1_i2.p1 TRINITY_DN6116_c0_g1~~TRINITY_DN6116_c0_g1_i2.p1  ORF type:complete len:276 (+),score=100.94 TRINITY_DN6116_c0_g1_i2:41-868(+)